MQLTNTPGKLVLPFANAGAKNTIPTASQIGITAGAASLTDGFPPLTRTPIAAGGVPPSGLDMNGILYELSAILRWANAGGGYAYDSTFANDSNVNGYPKGARIMRSDGLGYWFNTVENNTTDPEAAGAAAAGWVPDFTNGVTSVAMASANVTLTPLQYGKPIIVITGTLTANLNLIFPAIVNEWTVINNTTGPHTITCKTAAGTGLVVNTAALIVGDGTNIQSAVTDAAALFGETVATATGGTADAITATFTPVPRYPSNGVPLSVRATATNATATPTFTPNSGVIAAATIVKGNNLPLVAGDIAGAGHWLELAWDSTLSKWVLLNPATGINSFAQMITALPYPTVGSADLCLTVTSAIVGGTGGTVSIGAGTSFTLGEGLTASLGQLRTFTTSAWTSANLTANTTYYLRAQVIAGALTFYVQGGTDSDSIPGNFIGTPNAGSGGGFDSTQLDMLIAKVVTGANGTAPTVTKLANRYLLTFSSLYTPTLTADGNGGFTLTYSSTINWARTPKVTASLGYDITNLTTAGALDRCYIASQSVTRYTLSWNGYYDMNVSVSGSVVGQLNAFGVA